MQEIPLNSIRLDGHTQPRAELNMLVVADYAESYERGDTLPPIQVVFDGSHYWPWDGFHRFHARQQANFNTIAADVRPGTVDDARWLALSANRTHGLRRTNEDKRRSVEGALAMHPEMSDRAIAEHCGVTHPTVSEARQRLEESTSQPHTRLGRDGRTIDTSNIGRRQLPLANDEDESGTVWPQERKLVGYVTLDGWNKLSPNKRLKLLHPEEGNDRFNAQQNENIEWALWSWNPVTGCLHNCPYCYARDIAERFYEQKFAPSLWPSRLTAPRNTPFPEAKAAEWMGHKNVFVCSMADLFGRWVPREWIEAVLREVCAAPQWNFLFLTKFPIRMAEFDFPENAWVGTTVDCQARVANAEKAFRRVKAGVKWLSCEPMIEPLKFSDLGAFDWIVIGGSSRSSQTPEFRPPWQWWLPLSVEAHRLGVKVYYKTNLGVDRIREYPGIDTEPATAPAELVYLPEHESRMGSK
jgi:protein gp37